MYIFINVYLNCHLHLECLLVSHLILLVLVLLRRILPLRFGVIINRLLRILLLIDRLFSLDLPRHWAC